MEKLIKVFLIVSAALAIIALFPNVPLFWYIMFAATFMYAGYSESWNIVGGYAGYASMGHSALFGFSAYVVALSWHYFRISPILTPLLGGFVVMALSIVIGYPTMRLRGYYFSLATLSLPIISEAIIVSAPTITLGGFGISNVYIQEIPFALRPQAYYLIFLLYMVACVLIAYKIERSKFGMGLVAIREEEDAAVMCGVNNTLLKVKALMISGFLTGVAGGLFGSYITYVSPSSVFGLMMSITPVLMTILGGKGTWVGPLVGAFTLDLLRQYLAFTVLSVLNTLIFGGILIAITLLAPKGIVGMMANQSVQKTVKGIFKIKRGLLGNVRRKKHS